MAKAAAHSRVGKQVSRMAARQLCPPPIETPSPRDNRSHPRRGNFMNVQDRSGAFDLNKYGVGQPVRRTEDPVLVQGQGRYTDDVNLPGQAYAVFVRSRNAHGLIKGIDTGAAKGMPGVLAVYTGKDLEGYGTLKCVVPFKNRDGSEMKKPKRPSLPSDKVRFVGDPVAVVIAETLAQ